MRAEAFPEQWAGTARFTCGVPRTPTISSDGSRVLFLRSQGGRDRVTCLWSLDVASGEEVLLADPVALLAGGADDPTPEERRRRERAREASSGIVAYSTDEAVSTVCVALAGRLFVGRLFVGGRQGGETSEPGAEAETSEAEAETGAGAGAGDVAWRELPAAGPVVDPRPSPDGSRVAYVAGGALRVIGVDGSGDRELVADADPDVTWGQADFVAGEEMGRTRGHWWSPGSDALAVARVDVAPVPRWWITDPSDPAAPPQAIAYPAAGTTNAEVALAVVDLEGGRTEVVWDRAGYEYLVEVAWPERGLALVVQSRDQRDLALLDADPATGATTEVRHDHDDAWVELTPGRPAWTSGGALVWTVDDGGTRRLDVGGEAVTPPGLQVRAVLGTDGDAVLFTASEDPTETHVWSWSGAGLERRTTDPGVWTGVARAGTVVAAGRTLGPSVMAVTSAAAAAAAASAAAPPTRHVVASEAEEPVVTPAPALLRVGERDLATAVLWPSWHEAGAGRLPVLVDPYGGPGAQRAVAARGSLLESQWFAEQGFAVVVADGRGTPGRGPGWERQIHLDFATPVLEDQVDALHAVADAHPDLDLDRVAIRGWSFGGFLAALAVLRRPDVFHAAISGAPVTDQRLYDTHYMERYLGHPGAHPDAYERCSIVAEAAGLTRPLMLIHGLADDNVVVAHALRLSAAMLGAGRPHLFVPITGATHMASPPRLLELELGFLIDALGPLAAPSTASDGAR